MDAIKPETIAQLPLANIESVTFYKRDEVTADLICCEIHADGKTRLFHEESEGWSLLIQHLARLPGFRTDWLSAVSQPAFEACTTVAFRRG